MTEQNISQGHGGTISSYIVGFVLAVILTVIPFYMAMTGKPNFYILVLFAVVQIVVHVVCFLHINGSQPQRWNLMTFIFAVLAVLIIAVGSVWVMENTMQNMMSDKQHHAMQMLQENMSK